MNISSSILADDITHTMDIVPSESAEVGRSLTEEERVKLLDDTRPVTQFKKNKLELEAAKNWDLFYKRNRTNFFKDRHWTHGELIQLLPHVNFEIGGVLLEVGCGVGNFLFPFLKYFPSWTAFACDFSKRAVQFEHPDYCRSKCTAFICDITHENGELSLQSNCLSTVDLCTLVFVLSAICPDNMVTVAKNINKRLKVGGNVLVRDYGIYDHAMLRFKKGHKIEEYFYFRQDGTRAYYFSKDKLKHIFEEAGFSTVSIEYLNKATTNRKEDISVPRVFVQALFSKRM